MHKWLEKQAHFFFTTIIINKEYFQDEAFWFELGLVILFLSVPKNHLADVGEWDRTSLLQIFFIVPEERSLFWCPLPRVAEECSWTEPRN